MKVVLQFNKKIDSLVNKINGSRGMLILYMYRYTPQMMPIVMLFDYHKLSAIEAFMIWNWIK